MGTTPLVLNGPTLIIKEHPAAQLHWPPAAPLNITAAGG